MTAIPATSQESTSHASDPTIAACKCCGGEARVYGAVDFNRTCEDSRGPVFAPSGVDIPYHRCGSCGFIFTIAFDHFAAADFHRYIYNEDYVLADPDFVERRPVGNARLLAFKHFIGHQGLSVLDYGGGNGTLARTLEQLGFSRATTYDPFYAGAAPPAETFDLVTAFEVLEHSHTPYGTLKEMRDFMGGDGLMFFSTLLQPADIDQQGLRWWYASPRNGHVSLYSRESITALMNRLGLTWGSLSDLLHVAFRVNPPNFALHLFGR